MQTRILALLALAFLGLALIWSGPAFAINRGQQLKGVKLEVGFDKNIYVLGEPIIVTLTIRNVGNGGIEDRWFAYTRGFYLALEDSSRRPVQMHELESEVEQIITDWVCTL